MTEPIDMLQRDERAAEAKELLDNPLLQTILGQLEIEAREAMLERRAGVAGRHRLPPADHGHPRHQRRPDPSRRRPQDAALCGRAPEAHYPTR